MQLLRIKEKTNIELKHLHKSLQNAASLCFRILYHVV